MGIQTLYAISGTDANRLLKAANVERLPDAVEAANAAEASMAGAGFGTALENRKVERAAVSFVRRHFIERGWKVIDVSPEKRGFDLLCERGQEELHVEVKGSKGPKIQFIITANERDVWSFDGRFVLALVTDALRRNPQLRLFAGPRTLAQFRLKTISYVATLR